MKEIHAPHLIYYVHPATGARHFFHPVTGAPTPDPVPMGAQAEKYFGFPSPPGGVVGSYDDPGRRSSDRAMLIDERLHAAMDVLLPFFADEARPWTEEVTRAAREVRDFFPLAAEPGLWPYYEAEGKGFFAWVEKNAPPGRARLPWEETR